MKKLIILLTLAVFTFSVNAQRVYTFAGTAADTLTASVAKTYDIPVGTKQLDFSIDVDTDSVSGTPAYTAKLEYTLNGTDFYPILSAPDDVHTGGADNAAAWQSRYYKTFSVTGDTTTIFVHTPVLAKAVRVTLTATAAAQKSTISGRYIFVPYKD